MVAAAALALTACSLLQEDGGEKSIRINLPPIEQSASGNSRALSDDRLPTLKTETRRYRVTVNGMVHEGAGSSYEFRLPVGIRATAIIECLNSSGEVIIRAVKDFTVSSGENSVDINLKNDGNEIIPASAAGRVTYSYGDADRHGNKSGLPSDPTTYSEGDVFEVKDGSGMTWDHATQQSGFTGWSASPAIEPENGGQATNAPTSGQKYKMPRGGVTLTAQWNKKTYQIRYNANEPEDVQGNKATVTGMPQQATSVTALDDATAATAPSISNPFDSKNWTFTGWNTQAGGGGMPYRAGQQITMMTEDITLYAQWTSANVYTVTYNIGSGPSSADSGWIDDDRYTVGTSPAITLPTLTATGYDFLGWRIDGESNNRGGGTSYTPNASVTATAQWTPITYSITYNPDGGNVNTSTGATEFDVTTGTINLPQADGKTGYSFDYWKTADGTNVTGMGGEQLAALVPSGSTTLALTAVWREETYNIEYTVASSEGTGTGSASFTITQNGGQVTLNGGTAGFTRSGYRIASWKYDDGSPAGNAGAQVAAATLIAKAGGSTSLQLTAVWTPIQYTITYNANGGGNNPASTTFTVADGTVTLDTGSSLSKAGSAFVGWSTQQNGTAITDTSAQALIGLMSGSNTSVTLYAVWKTGFDVTDSSGSRTNYTTFDTAYTNAIAKTGAVTITLYSDASGVAKTLSSGKSLTIDLNGHIITGNGTARVFTVPSGATLTIQDTSTNADGKITGGKGGIEVTQGGSLTLESGFITGNNTGNVDTADSDNCGGGIYVDNATFTMRGGTISNNTAYYGGGVFIVGNSGTGTMYNGTITENTASRWGGGVTLFSDSSFTIKEGTITKNTANSTGGGVYTSASTLTQDGGSITGNSPNETDKTVF